MIYRLYIYGTTATTQNAMALDSINAALDADSIQQWKHGSPATYMKEFDTDAVKEAIEKTLWDRCRVTIKCPPSGFAQIPYLYIATSYNRAREVMLKLHSISAEYRLAFYDAERRKLFYKDVLDDVFITHRLRAQRLKNLILEKCTPVWDYKQIYIYESDRDKKSAFVVTLRKDPTRPLTTRVQQFHEILRAALIDEETLLCENRCFTVVGENYEITFCLEAYKKHPDRMGFYENNEPKVALLYRMGCTEALKWMEQCSDSEKRDILRRMNFYEMMERYKNPGDRFVESVNITKQTRKELHSVRYSDIGPYDSEIIFHVVPEDLSEECVSALKIEEECASFILPFVEDIYPHFYKRYYLTKNHMPKEMMWDIINRLEWAKEMILNDTHNPVLKPYMQKFNLYILLENSHDFYEDIEIKNQIKNYPEQFLYEHRYEAARIYDMFLKWVDVQLDTYCSYGEDIMFNIQGP